MIHRNNYLNRPQNSKYKKHDSKRQRLSKNLQETCVNWEVPLENDESEDAIENNKKKLIELSYQKTYTKEQFEYIRQLMDKYYASQRKFLNNLDDKHTVKDIRKEWPFLLEKSFIQRHFHKLTEVDPKIVIENFDQNIKKIIKFAMEKKGKLLSEAYEDDSNVEYAALKFVALYLNEDIENIAKRYPIGTTQAEIRPLGSFPWIGIVQTELDTIFYIFMDNEIINCQSTTFKEAIVQNVCLFFNFNQEYPEKISQTYEFFQRLFFQLNVEKSRGKKKNMSSMAKVMRLIEKIRETIE